MPVPENLVWEAEKNLKFMNRRNDIRFGDIFIYKDERTQRKVIKIEKKSSDKNKLAQDVLHAKERMKLQSNFLHQMLGWSVNTEKGLCSTTHFVNMFFDYPTSDLRNEVSMKKKKNMLMGDGSLSNVVSNSLQGLEYIHTRGLAHGDIRPMLIGCERQNHSKEVGHSMLLDRLADQSSIEKTQTNKMLNKKQLYMSPQLYKLINTKGKNKPYFNRQKNDLFALGMSILSAGNGKSMNNCYVKGGDFNVNKLNEHKDEFNMKYQNNPNLCQVVSDLVQIEESMRPDPTVMAKVPQVVYQNVDDLNDREEIVEVETNTFYKKKAEPYVHNAAPVESQTAHPLDHEEHYVKPGEEVVYGEPKVVRTYVDENSRRADKGEVKTEIVRLKNAYDPNKHEVEEEVSNQYKSTPYAGPQVYKRQAPEYKSSTPTYVNAQPQMTYKYNQPPTTTYVNSSPNYNQPTTTTYENSSPNYNQPTTTTYVNSSPTYNQPTTTTYVNSSPTYAQPTTTYVNSSPTYTQNPPQEDPKSNELRYDVSERKTVQFHNLKFDNRASETEPENRFEEPVKSRIAESGEDLESFPPEGKVIRKRIKIKDAEGNIVEEYDEPVK